MLLSFLSIFGGRHENLNFSQPDKKNPAIHFDLRLIRRELWQHER